MRLRNSSNAKALDAYEAGSHRLASVTSGPSVRAFDYTAAGSTSLDTRGGVEVEFGYGASGQLVQVTSDSGPLASRTYGYDAAGKRVRETRVDRLPGGGGVISTSHGYVYDLDGHLLAEYDYAVSGQVASVRREYVWLGDTPVAMVDHAAPGDPLLAIHTDHLGRPQKLTDASQVVVWDGQFDPFGEEHAVTGTTDQPLRFPGQEWDAATVLSQNWNRDYDPTLGRYIESDPIGLAGGINTYMYVGGNPVSYSDAKGLNPFAGAYPGAGIGSAFGPFGTVVGGFVGAGVGAWIGWNVAGPMLAKPPADAANPTGAKAPGMPGQEEGYCEPEGGPDWVKNPNGSGHGWRDASGDVWVPTGPGGKAHGGPHWDVQTPGGGYVNVYPGGARR